MPQPTRPSLSERYQEATKYTPRSVQEQHTLDFESQPAAFKSWHQARRYPLAGGSGEAPTPTPGPLEAQRLGRLLFHTYGVTLVREYPTMTMQFRASPSAGGLYPTELYVALRDMSELPDGIYAYDAPSHALVLCWEGSFWPDLQVHALGHPALVAARAVLIGTGLWERSIWRYQDRGYRRVLLDTGHVFGNAMLAGTPDGLRVIPMPYFDDAGVAGLLLLDDDREAPLLLAAVLEEEPGAGPSQDLHAWCSPAHKAHDPLKGEWAKQVQRAGMIQAATARPAEAAAEQADDDPPAVGEALALSREPLLGGAAVLAAIRRRRSTRRFLPGARISTEALGRILAHAYLNGEAALRMLPEYLRTWLVLTGVEGTEDGVYRYDPKQHEIEATRLGNASAVMHKTCLWQELGRDCTVAIVHTLDLPAAIATHGERVYRTAHLDAGLIGQRLNMAALRLGYGASGIAGFFDDFVNELLQLGPQHATVYITTIGVPG